MTTDVTREWSFLNSQRLNTDPGERSIFFSKDEPTAKKVELDQVPEVIPSLKFLESEVFPSISQSPSHRGIPGKQGQKSDRNTKGSVDLLYF